MRLKINIPKVTLSHNYDNIRWSLLTQIAIIAAINEKGDSKMTMDYFRKLLNKFAFLSLKNLDPKDQKRIMNLSNSEVEKLLNLNINFDGEISDRKKQLIGSLISSDVFWGKNSAFEADINYILMADSDKKAEALSKVACDVYSLENADQHKIIMINLFVMSDAEFNENFAEEFAFYNDTNYFRVLINQGSSIPGDQDVTPDLVKSLIKSNISNIAN